MANNLSPIGPLQELGYVGSYSVKLKKKAPVNTIMKTSGVSITGRVVAFTGINARVVSDHGSEDVHCFYEDGAKYCFSLKKHIVSVKDAQGKTLLNNRKKKKKE
jgi:hypothetical protein